MSTAHTARRWISVNEWFNDVAAMDKIYAAEHGMPLRDVAEPCCRRHVEEAATRRQEATITKKGATT